MGGDGRDDLLGAVGHQRGCTGDDHEDGDDGSDRRPELTRHLDPADADEQCCHDDCERHDDVKNLTVLVVVVVGLGHVDEQPGDGCQSQQDDENAAERGKAAEQTAQRTEPREEVQRTGDGVVAEGCRCADHEDQQDDDPVEGELAHLVSEHCRFLVFPVVE